MNRFVQAFNKMISRIDFWSIREPRVSTLFTNLPRSSDRLRGLKGFEFLGELNHSDPTIHNAVRMVTNMLFDYRRDDKHFEVECENPRLREAVERELLDRLAGRQAKFGIGNHDLVRFLRSKAASIMVYGRSFSRVGWQENEGDSAHWRIKSFRGLFPGSIRPIGKEGYEWKRRQSEYDLNSPIVTERLSKEEIFSLEWVFDGEANRSKPPLERVVKHYKRGLDFMTLCAANTYAWANPNDKRFWVERARHADMKKAIEEERQRRLLMTKELGIPELYPPPPTTSYYDVYYMVKFRKRLAQIREYLVSQFNEQVVRQLAVKNGFSEHVALRAISYRTVKEIEDVFEQFGRKELAAEDVTKTLGS